MVDFFSGMALPFLRATCFKQGNRRRCLFFFGWPPLLLTAYNSPYGTLGPHDHRTQKMTATKRQGEAKLQTSASRHTSAALFDPLGENFMPWTIPIQQIALRWYFAELTSQPFLISVSSRSISDSKHRVAFPYHWAPYCRLFQKSSAKTVMGVGFYLRRRDGLLWIRMVIFVQKHLMFRMR